MSHDLPRLLTVGLVFFVFFTNFLVLFALYSAASILAVYLVGESVRRVFLFRGKRHVTRKWHDIEWEIGWDAFGDTKIWDVDVVGISKKKLRAIHYGGPILMVPIALVLFLLIRVKEYPLEGSSLAIIFLYTAFFISIFLAGTGVVHWYHLPDWEEELNSK